MKLHRNVSTLVLSTFFLCFLVSCQDALTPLDEEERVSVQAITKGSPGALNGDVNYCNDELNLCGLGEGDCDSSTQCEAGLVCGRDNGAKFGFSAGADVCVPAHCTNRVSDGDEVGLNCGGSCGTCPLINPYPIGHSLHCADPRFPCVLGEGQCNADDQCALGLVCGKDLGANFGLNFRVDVCVPAHCTDGVISGDEFDVDCGGTCGACSLDNPYTLGSRLFCSIPWLPCGLGEGHCRSDSECSGALICAGDRGAQFGLNAFLDVCMPSHCLDGLVNGDETAIDCGGSCGTCLSQNPYTLGSANYCSNPNFLCQQGEGDCNGDAQCDGDLVCGRDNGARFGYDDGVDVCVPAHCKNKRYDGDEIGLDCGGSCGTCDETHPYPLGSRLYCADPRFPCQSGEGNCSGDGQCEEGLVCGRDRGAKYGYARGVDVCMPAHCRDGVLSGDETSVDCGGACGDFCAFATGTSGGGSHSCASLDDGSARCWGDNGSGQLGDGTTTSRSQSSSVLSLSGVVRVVVGLLHSCALIDDGTVKCWGDNTYGQLGNGSFDSSLLPVSVSSLTGVVDLSVGDYHVCALLAGGGVKCWGDNQEAQLGDGTRIARNVPVTSLVGGVVSQIAAGGQNSCALIDDGTVKCWGDNAYGQLGRGTLFEGVLPGSVTGLLGVAHIAVGESMCATLSSGAVVCWGLNAHGQLGDGTLIDRLLPVAVLGLGSVLEVVIGGQHACALIDDGTVKCWGDNASGQLGDGTLNGRLLQGPVAQLVDAVTLSAGKLHTCAHSQDGTVKCWGKNMQGQLGDGSTQDATLPVSVVFY